MASAEPLNPKGAAKENTPLVPEGKPSFELAMTRARLRLLRDPDTGLPYSLWGICANFQAFELLGPAAAAHTRIMSWCILVCFVTSIFSVPLRGIANDPKRVNEAGTVAAWTELTWGHVILDVIISVIFLAFIMREQFLLMEPSMFQGKLFQRRVVEQLAGSAILKPIAKVGDKLENALEKRSGGMAYLPRTNTDNVEYELIEPPNTMIDQALLVEACSVVLSGWGRGLPIPAGALAAVEAAAGAKPYCAVQAVKCLQLELARERVAQETKHVCEAEAHLKSHPGEKRTEALARCRESLAAAQASVESALMNQKSQDELLDYVFVTFKTSKQKASVLEAAKRGTLFTSLECAGIVTCQGPNPRDVAWRNLEATPHERMISNVFFVVSMLLISSICSAVFSFFCVLTPLLDASPLAFAPFSSYPKRFLYFLAIVAVYATSIQGMIQPIFCALSNRGLFCNPRFRVMSNTYTALHAKCGSFWLWVEFIIQAFVLGFYAFLTVGEDHGEFTNRGKLFAEDLTNALGTPQENIDFFKMYGTEVQNNVQNAIIFECFLGAWALPAAQQYLLAPFRRTQKAMDADCRLINHGILPFTISDSMRILAFVMWWSSVFPVACIPAVLYFLMATFVCRSNLMGRIEPGPPTKQLLYRLTFTVYLPFHMIVRFLIAIQMYCDVPLEWPKSLPLGMNGADWLHEWNKTPEKATHFFLNILLIFVTLVVMPLVARARAVERGVLTPWELLKMACYGPGLNDPGFDTSARVGVGAHHMTSRQSQGGRKTGWTAYEGGEVELPDELKAEATYPGNASATIELVGPSTADTAAVSWPLGCVSPGV